MGAVAVVVAAVGAAAEVGVRSYNCVQLEIKSLNTNYSDK
jgi:hypothetical protein